MNKKISCNDDLGFYIKKINNHIEREFHSLYKKANIHSYSLMNMQIVNFLYNMEKVNEHIFQKDIEEEFFINKATASKMLSLMEEKELIKRVSLETDARLKKIILMEKGRNLQKKSKELIISLEKKLQKDISLQDIEIFKSLCKKIIKNME